MSANVLIVDDKPSMRATLSSHLELAGYTIETAPDGQVAMEILRQREFELVLSDIRMPNMGGLELLRAARQLAPETEVIIVTAYADLRLAVQCLRAGAFDLLQKPVNAYDLLATVSRALERHELRAAAALYRAGQALFSARELDRLPQRIVDIACRLLRAEDVGLLLAGPDGRPAVVRALGGVPEADRLALAARLEGAVEVALASGPAHAAGPLAGLAGFVGLTCIAAPLRYAGEGLGLLTLARPASRGPYKDSDLERVSIFTGQIGLALDNARLVSDLLAGAAPAERGGR
jgi:CheY-like chemotaxis protein